MDTDKLDELAELLAASTPPPWKVNQNWLDIPWLNRADAALICAAINALPGLIESAKRVERLESELDQSALRNVRLGTQLRDKDSAMGVLFKLLDEHKIDYSELIP
jgi:hypothetical protein